MDNTKSITKKIQEVLDATFTDIFKRQIYETSDRINFACPYCRDSKYNSRKKRGNVYLDDLHFKCFNCGKYTSLAQLLYDFDVSFSIDDNFIKTPKKQKPIDTIDYNVFGKFFILEKSDFLYRIDGKEVTENKKCLEYLKSRRIPEEKYDLFGDVNNNIIIMNLVNWKNKEYVVNYNTRTNNPNYRYILTDFKKMNEKFSLGFNENDSLFQSFDRLASVFNVFNVNVKEVVTIFEGEFDALSFPCDNTIALSGVTKNMGIKLPNKRYMLDNRDLEGRKKTIQLLEQGETVFMWHKLIEKYNLERYKIKDMNDLRIVLDKIDVDIYNIDFNMFFTNNVLDLIAI